MNFYNEIDPFAAAWLRELIKADQIAPGIVDERSIEDITPDELRQYTQCHFFAGIGVWSYALRCAGWPDDRPVWTGSCPCQSLSTATHGKSTAKELWPAFEALIAGGKPSTVFGEQVPKHWWVDRLVGDLESLDYNIGGAILPAYSTGKDHARARFYFVAYSYLRPKHDGTFNAKTQMLPRNCSDASELLQADGITTGMASRRICRGFGNALVAPVAQAFIEAFLEHEQTTV